MGSLPNLHELEEAERKREKRREYELLLEQRARDTSRERERLSMFAQQRKQSSYNAYIMAGLGIGGGSLSLTATASTGTNSAAGNGNGTTDTGNSNGTAAAISVFSKVAPPIGNTATTTLSGFAMLGLAAKKHSHTHPFHQHSHQHQHHQHHRHSLTTRHRVLRTRSSTGAQNVWDEQMMEHLSAYSPISTRSHRINPVSSYQVQAALAASRRRESINSSIGATSIRRLISLNSRNCRHKVPAHVRQKAWRHFSCLTIAHGLMSAVLLPVLALQGSNSVWHHREQWLPVGPSIGSLLLSVLFLLAAGTSLVVVRLIRRYDYTSLLAASYLAISFFLVSHFYTSIFTLLPAYMLLGLSLGIATSCKVALIVQFGGKLSCSQHECTMSAAQPVDGVLYDEHKMFCNRDQKVRRLARWFRVSQDLGLILGALVASLVLVCTARDWNCFESGGLTAYATNNETAAQIWPRLEDYYNRNEHGERICGADMCPLRRSQMPSSVAIVSSFNGSISNSSSSVIYSPSSRSIYASFIESSGRTGANSLIGIYLFLSLGSLVLTLAIGKIQATFRQERVKDVADTLLYAGPLAYFVGTEQAYMLGDFLRAFVSCSLGISMVAGALIGMGLMQLIVSCTLSMLLRHTKRIVVILAGFFFHSCLLLALSSWKPSSDDSALFYVIAASWGACNGMWETLLLALVTLNHVNQVTEVTASLQALRFLGLGVTFAAHGFLCESAKIIALVILLVISVPPYAMLEIRLEAQRKATLISL